MKILVVEDDRRMSAILVRGLTAEGFAVDVAGGGDEGLWKATEFGYDAIVLDLMLPGRNGFEVSRALRASGNWTPVLVLTARDSERDETSALGAGADDYLAKPFSFPVLVARLHALLRRTQGGAPAPVAVGDLRLDVERHRCWRGEEEVTLTAREFSVLEYLVRRSGRTVSKAQLIDGVWDFGFEGDPNIVEVYIRRLRRKVDEPYGLHCIETVRGVGYRMTASP